ncbi:MAG: hypothetical protein AAFV29_13605 [Myxococcota bacterium]
MVHVILLALGIGAAAQLLTMSDAFSGSGLQTAAEVKSVIRAQLDGFMVVSAPILFLTLTVGWVPLQAQLRSRMIGVALWALLGLVSAQWLNPRLSEIRGGLGRSLDGLSASAPGGADWAQMSTISHTLLVAQLVVGLVLLLMSVTASGPKRSFGGIQL